MNKTAAVPINDEAPTVTPVESLPPQHSTTLDALCRQVRGLSDQIAALEALRTAMLKHEIAPLAMSLGVTRVVGPGWTLSEQPGGRKDVVPEKLLAAGVSMATITACTVERKWSSWQVRARTEQPTVIEE